MNKKIREDFEEIPVEIVEEKWNNYKLADHATIRARPIMIKIFWPKEMKKLSPDKAIDLRGSFQKIVVPLCNKDLEGKPSGKLPSSIEEALKMDSEPVKIITSEELWNTYELPGGRGRLKVKMVVADVVKIKGIYDENGVPYYLVNSSLVISPSF